jgi:hypothetical protein
MAWTWSKWTALVCVVTLVPLLVAGTASCSSDDERLQATGAPAETPRNADDDGQVHVGVDAKTDLAVFFDQVVTDSEISAFIESRLRIPLTDGRSGTDLPSGVQSTLADYERRAVYVGFFDDATAADRHAVKETALASPLVDRVEEGVVPSEHYPKS